MIDLSFYKNKKVLVTGHTGFKGTWLCEMLCFLKADVYGYGLKAEEKSLYNLTKLDNKMKSYIGDIRDFNRLFEVFNEIKPEIVIHMAAQSIVKEGYDNPRYTYETNVMGTVNIMECLRLTNCVKSFINVTTDKVYQNNNNVCLETDILNGYDPYSNSKSCSELVCQTYVRSFFNDKDISISTMRSGNVIGGGDFSKYRIMSDCMRAYLNKEDIIIRRPTSIRPYQHVLDCLVVYLVVAEEQYNNKQLSGSYNVGPDLDDYINNQQLINLFINNIKLLSNTKMKYKIIDSDFYEEDSLRLDTNKIKEAFNYQRVWNLNESVKELCKFIIKYENNEDLQDYVKEVVEKFLFERENKHV